MTLVMTYAIMFNDYSGSRRLDIRRYALSVGLFGRACAIGSRKYYILGKEGPVTTRRVRDGIGNCN